MNDNEFDRRAGDMLRNEEAAPPAHTWSRIEKILDANRRPAASWKWWLSGILLLVAAGTAWWLTSETTAGKNKATAQQTPNVQQQTPAITSPVTSNASPAPLPAQQNTKTIALPAGNSPGHLTVATQHAQRSIQKTASPENAGDNVVANTHKDKRVSHPKNSSAKTNQLSPLTVHTVAHNAVSSPVKTPAEKKNAGNEPGAQAGNTVIAGSTGSQHGYDPLPPGNSTARGETGNETVALPPAGTPADQDALSSSTDEPVSPHKSGGASLKLFSGHGKKNDDADAQDPVVNTDSLRQVSRDSMVYGGTPPPPPSTTGDFSPFYAALHGVYDDVLLGNEAGSSGVQTGTDINVYDPTSMSSLPQQSYSAGARFGWFVSKRISLTGGLYFSTFSMDGEEGSFSFNHNEECEFVFHTAAVAVEMPSSSFDHNDSYAPQGDMYAIHMQAKEKYDYINLQLGASWYAVRRQHFGLYADLLSNGAFLTQQQLTLSIPQSGKTFDFGSGAMSGMKSFVLGGQCGIGAEYLPVPRLGIFAEPSWYFSAAVNSNSTVILHPDALRFLMGMTFHF